tara:strand:- start:1159 stop:1377 length:219 start_codon:yes stop_codon:yes gene_type:complete
VLEKGSMFEARTLPWCGPVITRPKMDQPLPDAAKIALVDRDIAFFNDKGNLVLTDAGKTFFEDLISQRSSKY